MQERLSSVPGPSYRERRKKEEKKKERRREGKKERKRGGEMGRGRRSEERHRERQTDRSIGRDKSRELSTCYSGSNNPVEMDSVPVMEPRQEHSGSRTIQCMESGIHYRKQHALQSGQGSHEDEHLKLESQDGGQQYIKDACLACGTAGTKTRCYLKSNWVMVL